MILLEEVLKIHNRIIKEFGGKLTDIRDIALLESAIARPFQTFDGQDLYATPVEKAAAIIESILINHPFADGNKRTGFVLMRLILLLHGIDINATEDERYDFVISIAKGDLDLEGIKEWLRGKIYNINGSKAH